MKGGLLKRTGGPCIKVSNLAWGTTGATLKESLQQWGVTGIEEVVISEGRAGPIALLRFKAQEQAELMMMANGVEVEGMPMVLEYLPAAPRAPRPHAGSLDTAKKAPPSSLAKVTGLPKDTGNKELTTFLRSYGVLGLAEVIVSDCVGLVRFQTEKNVEAAIEKANGASLQGEKITLRPIGPAEWRELEGPGPDGDDGPGWGWGDGSGYDWGMQDGSWSFPAGGFGCGGFWHSPGSAGWERDGPEAAGKEPGSAGLGGQKASRGSLPPGVARGQQSSGGTSSGGPIRPKQPWGPQDSGGGGSSSSAGKIQGAGGRAAAGSLDESSIPAAFRAQAQARKSAAREGGAARAPAPLAAEKKDSGRDSSWKGSWGGSESRDSKGSWGGSESRDSWKGGSWAGSGDSWDSGRKGGGYHSAASKGGYSAGWGGEDRGWGGASKGGGGTWVKRSAPY